MKANVVINWLLAIFLLFSCAVTPNFLIEYSRHILVTTSNFGSLTVMTMESLGQQTEQYRMSVKPMTIQIAIGI